MYGCSGVEIHIVHVTWVRQCVCNQTTSSFDSTQDQIRSSRRRHYITGVWVTNKDPTRITRFDGCLGDKHAPNTDVHRKVSMQLASGRCFCAQNRNQCEISRNSHIRPRVSDTTRVSTRIFAYTTDTDFTLDSVWFRDSLAKESGYRSLHN
jgi:hypothetical protein